MNATPVKPDVGSFTFPARVLYVHDGDTMDVAIMLGRTRGKDHDFGFHVYREAGWFTLHVSIRLYGINADEANTPGGALATAWVKGRVKPNDIVTLKTQHHAGDPDKWGGRWDAIVLLADGTNLNDAIVASGNAAPWSGTGPKPTV